MVNVSKKQQHEQQIVRKSEGVREEQAQWMYYNINVQRAAEGWERYKEHEPNNVHTIFAGIHSRSLYLPEVIAKSHFVVTSPIQSTTDNINK